MNEAKIYSYTYPLRMELKEVSKKILDNKTELLRLNIERKHLKNYYNDLLRYKILTFYAVMVNKHLEDNLKLINCTSEEQKKLKHLHSKLSKTLGREIYLKRKSNDETNNRY